jgi:hypothetical protein
LDSTADLVIVRDTANTLAQRNGVNTQTFNLYNTYTSATSTERATFKFVNNDFVIGAETLPLSGPQRSMIFQTASATRMTILSSGVVQVTGDITANRVFTTRIGAGTTEVMKVFTDAVQMDTSKHFVASTDNTSDIGDPASKRFRNGYFAGRINTGSLSATGDIEITDATKGIILKAPNGTRWRTTVTNTGALSTVSI